MSFKGLRLPTARTENFDDYFL